MMRMRALASFFAGPIGLTIVAAALIVTSATLLGAS